MPLPALKPKHAEGSDTGYMRTLQTQLRAILDALHPSANPQAVEDAVATLKGIVYASYKAGKQAGGSRSSFTH